MLVRCVNLVSTHVHPDMGSTSAGDGRLVLDRRRTHCRRVVRRSCGGCSGCPHRETMAPAPRGWCGQSLLCARRLSRRGRRRWKPPPLERARRTANRPDPCQQRSGRLGPLLARRPDDGHWHQERGGLLPESRWPIPAGPESFYANTMCAAYHCVFAPDGDTCAAAIHVRREGAVGETPIRTCSRSLCGGLRRSRQRCPAQWSGTWRELDRLHTTPRATCSRPGTSTNPFDSGTPSFTSCWPKAGVTTATSTTLSSLPTVHFWRRARRTEPSAYGTLNPDWPRARRSWALPGTD